MFEIAEVGNRLQKSRYNEDLPQLRVDLVNAQFDLRQADFPLLLLVVGDDRQGGEELVDILNEWMDARYIDTEVFLEPTDEERQRPLFWRYWRALPPRGSTTLFFNAWPAAAIRDRAYGVIDGDGFHRRLAHIRSFEEALVRDGALLLKFWLHLPHGQHRKRLEQVKRGSAKAWRVEEADWLFHEHYDQLMPMAETLLAQTSSERCPWHVVESTDARYRNYTVARTVLDALTARIARPPPPLPAPAAAISAPGINVLEGVDLTRTLAREEFRERLERQQQRLAKRMRKAREAGLSTVLVFEGWDAAGKGGVIRRLTGALPARDYRIVPIATPTDEELSRHYLWRFWRQLPRAGRMLIFDRSWYGRVLVERVEGYASTEQWLRAYGEINDFEAQLLEHGTVVLKFWLHISRDEQLRRFDLREKTPYKKYKITDEDYRNREKWNGYERAVNDMVAHTSTASAPWHLVPANDKRWARVQVLEALNAALAVGLKARRRHRRKSDGRIGRLARDLRSA